MIEQIVSGHYAIDDVAIRLEVAFVEREQIAALARLGTLEQIAQIDRRNARTAGLGHFVEMGTIAFNQPDCGADNAYQRKRPTMISARLDRAKPFDDIGIFGDEVRPS